jgi:hypothetical protein
MKAIGTMLFAIGMAWAAAQTPTSEKVIKDAGEYNAYVTALNEANPAEKGALMEAFVQNYPGSIVKVEALEQAMGAYQQTGNTAKVEEMSARILAIEPGHVRALAIQAYLFRQRATQGNVEAVGKLAGVADRGLKALPAWQKPEGVSDEDFAKLVRQMASILNGAAGFARLQQKDYAAARDFYLQSVAADPANLQDVYQLSIAELEMGPLDPNGFWHAAKALSLAKGNAAAQDSIGKYASAKYQRYHGGKDGWEQIVAQAESQASVPDNFAASIKRAPTPAEIAVQAVRDNDPSSLSFSDWEYVLSYRDVSAENKEAAEKVWQTLRAKEKDGQARLKLPVKVIAAMARTIQGAISDENQSASTVDVEVTFEKPPGKMPPIGSLIYVTGVIEDYRVNPVVFVMDKGELAGKN